ncbi:hypothetical protein M0813_03079 [Anaeramoeba flamelloides]|uniref:Pyroglutamyl-peptidase I n=1 Tax=Anaeramoeba flamelloides TaxID=1746091 RepID=A0ABQ8Y722_9EUKA|nr:hypothetical protein M0813_03079 [Anaeramoeba flamelloides]
MKVAQKLNNTQANINGYKLVIESWILSVDEKGVKSVASYLGDHPDEFCLVVHMGLYSSAPWIRLETVATNILAHDDLNPPKPIFVGGPDFLPTTLDLNMLSIADMKDSLGVSKFWTRDAGEYFCNEIYYRTLYQTRIKGIRNNGKFLPVLFIHLPKEETVSIEQDLAAVSKVIQIIASQTIL